MLLASPSVTVITTDVEITSTDLFVTSSTDAKGSVEIHITSGVFFSKVPTTVQSTLQPTSSTSGVHHATATELPRGPLTPAGIGGIITSIVLFLLIDVFCLWRRRYRRVLARKASLRHIEEGSDDQSHPNRQGQNGGPASQMAQLGLSEDMTQGATAFTSTLNTPAPPRPVPRKVRLDRAAELERQLEAARLALQESEGTGSSGRAASDLQSEPEQTWQDQVAALRAEVDRLRSALAVANSVPPPAYEGERQSVATQVVTKQ